MTTANALPQPSVPTRGALQKTFVPARVLAGFTDADHLNLILGEYLSTLPAEERTRILEEADACRAAVVTLPPEPLDDVLGAALGGPHIDAISASPVFRQSFPFPLEFRTVRLEHLVAVQTHVKPRADPIPTSPDELMAFALPSPMDWRTPAEVTFIQPSGPIQILTSVPTFAGLHLEMDAVSGRVSVAPAPHVNLIQVAAFAGRFYLRNGYHRVVDALAAGVTELPALVFAAPTPAQVEVHQGCFGVPYTAGLARPPLMKDFAGPAALTACLRERRYGVVVSLDVRPLNFGI